MARHTSCSCLRCVTGVCCGKAERVSGLFDPRDWAQWVAVETSQPSFDQKQADQRHDRLLSTASYVFHRLKQPWRVDDAHVSNGQWLAPLAKGGPVAQHAQERAASHESFTPPVSYFVRQDTRKSSPHETAALPGPQNLLAWNGQNKLPEVPIEKREAPLVVGIRKIVASKLPTKCLEGVQVFLETRARTEKVQATKVAVQCCVMAL